MEKQHRLEQQMQFALEIDKEKQIGRQTYCSDNKTKENDAEHAWHAALMTILLSEYAEQPIDVQKTVTMLLIHDIVEIDAGDTYAYDDAGIATQAEREMKAANRIFGILPEDQGKKMMELWLEFEAQESAEARFAKVMDNIQPIMLNAATDGRAWAEHEVKLSKILKRNKNVPGDAPALWDYMLNHYIMPNVESGRIIDDREEQMGMNKE